jgi:hypothetical protein
MISSRRCFRAGLPISGLRSSTAIAAMMSFTRDAASSTSWVSR